MKVILIFLTLILFVSFPFFAGFYWRQYRNSQKECSQELKERDAFWENLVHQERMACGE